MELESEVKKREDVALFTRAWIEITIACGSASTVMVALFTRAWIEIEWENLIDEWVFCRPLHEGVD